MARLTLRQQFEYAKRNPESEITKALVTDIQSGSLDEAALDAGLNLTGFGRPSRNEILTKKQVDPTVESRFQERKGIRNDKIEALKAQRDAGVKGVRGELLGARTEKVGEGASKLLNLTALGEGIGQAADEIRGKLSKKYDSISEINEKRLDSVLEQQDTILGKLKEARESGDTEGAEQMESLLQKTSDQLYALDVDISERIGELPSDREVIGSAVSLAALAAGGQMAKGVGTGLAKVAPALTAPTTSVVRGALGKGVEMAAQAAPTGFGTGLGRGITDEDKGVGGVIGTALKEAGIAALVSGAIGGVVGGTQSFKAGRQARYDALDEMLTKSPTDKRVVEYMKKGEGQIVTDKSAKEAIRQGVDEGSVALAKGSNPATKSQMSKMLDQADEAFNNKRITRRPMDTVGENLMKRYKVVAEANKSARNSLDDVARGLQGKSVDFSKATSSFSDSLAKANVSVGDDGVLNFTQSVFKNNPTAQNTLQSAVDDLAGLGGDAYKGHIFKQQIDDVVSYGKRAEGLTGRAEAMLKGLRRGLDSTLDDTFTQYNQVNTQYAQTRGILDDFSKAAGSRFNPSSPYADINAGQVVRRVLGNAQSRASNMALLDSLESASKSLGKTFDDDLVAQALWADTLEEVYGTQAVTSLQGEVSKALGVSKGKGLAGLGRKLTRAEGVVDLTLDAIGQGLISMQNINPEALRNSLQALVR